MVEKLVGGFGEVMDGRKTWKDLLKGFVEEASAGASPPGSDRGGSSSRKRRDR